MTARWPQPEGDPERLFVYRVTAEHGWTHLAAGGVGADGLRTGGECAPTHDGRQSCELWVEDTVTGLSYAFMSQWIDDRAFDGAPVPEEFRNTALKLRALIDSLAADAADPLEAPG